LKTNEIAYFSTHSTTVGKVPVTDSDRGAPGNSLPLPFFPSEEKLSST
jgi:hypothetical protein